MVKTNSKKIEEHSSCHECPIKADCRDYVHMSTEERNKGCMDMRAYVFKTLRDLEEPIMFLKKKIVEFELKTKKNGWKEDPKDPNNLKGMKLYSDLAKSVNDLDPAKLNRKLELDYHDNFGEEVVIEIPESVQEEIKEEKKEKVKEDS